MVGCSAYRCKSRSEKKEPRITFHSEESVEQISSSIEIAFFGKQAFSGMAAGRALADSKLPSEAADFAKESLPRSSPESKIW
ncbi:hypothetical protein HUJ04_010416 [Dendroctonus ponderosae]|nr:hypothetical protein HUJ04_010416 [Dendroctonus ponderosae]